MFNQKPLFYLDDSKFKRATLQPRGVKLKLILASIFIGLSLAPKAIMAPPADISGAINSEEQRIRSIRQGVEDPFITIHSEQSSASSVTAEPKKAGICFKIYEIKLINAEAQDEQKSSADSKFNKADYKSKNEDDLKTPAKATHPAPFADHSVPPGFERILNSTLKELKFKSSDCLGSDEILALARAYNNKIISAGFITTSVSIPQQNISSGTLLLALHPGRIGEISLEPDSEAKNQRSIFTAFGGDKRGEILNLRDLEQAMENFNAASRSEAEISLSPSAKQGYSDINISKQQSLPLLFRLSADNLGSKASGKYQGATMLYGLNLLGLNESVFASYGRNFLRGDKKSLGDDSKSGRSANYYAGFSIPFGYFSLSFWQNRYTYDQIVPGAYELYTYSGSSVRRNLDLNYVYFRNQNSKNSLFFRIWQKKYKNYIQDYELSNQRKREGGYEAGLKSKVFFDNSSVEMMLSYLKSTGAFNALRAPDEDFGGGSSRYHLINAALNFKTRSSAIPLSYELELYARRANTHLSPIDRLNIGGYYSVRGFDSQMSLLGDSGFYIRNTLEYKYFKNNGVYLAFDVGKLSSKGKDYPLQGEMLSGGGVGLRGNISGSFSYDLLAAFPISKPENFKTDSPALNFSLSYDF
ncbi:ShlB/FhaC/HecB family hemolysin secretion/activation protein [uncultured Campylobacter sp.]|uniref:ShlB/FhaC/HecB family hemolysin secretion/activation protein n=1 Tax=uncultured Campylobacter sp. TaxID=218934 RepID=UPI0026159480|nr:ShlB/FhaC/HecB family hemolysin secretion/activation protein [uncultured Campylobacter sp.]